MQPLWNPAENFLQGLTVAQRIKDTLARRQMEERQLKMAEEEQARSREVRNIQLLGEIVRNARPVSGAGTVTERTKLNPQMEGLPSAMQPKVLDVQNERQVDPGRSFAFGGNQYEFLSPEDQQARALEQSRLAGEQQNTLAMDRFRGQAAVTDRYNEKDRDLRRELQTGQITAQEYIAGVRAQTEAAKLKQQQDFQTQLERNRQAFQETRDTARNDTTLKAAAIRKAGRGGGSAAPDSMVQAVMANPQLFQQLTPTQRTALIPQLQAAGFQGFGKDAAAGDIRKLGELQSALEGVGELRSVMEKGSGYVGPIAGYQSVIPWSEGRQVQASIDLIRQKVGRALEGGVLRKEDEEKYKKILPTINDTMETAKYKIAMLEQELQRDIGTLSGANQGVGRRVPAMGGGAPAASGNPYAAPAGGGATANPYR